MYYPLVPTETSGNEGDQQDVNGPQDCIQAFVGDDTKAEGVPIDSESEGKGDVIHVQQVQRVQEPMGGPSIMWRWEKFLLVQ